jgi:hypothetical protein
MNKLNVFFLSAMVGLTCQTPLIAQESTGANAASTNPPPKVLMIMRELLKPGRAGEIHKKSETAFVRAMSSAKWPTHYLAITSLSGRPRALFLTAYGSFEEAEKDSKAMENNAVLSAALDRAAVADGDLLSDMDGGTFVYREDYSLKPNVDLPHMRYFEIAQFHVKPGHDADWDQAVKMVLKANEDRDLHYACYQAVYGAHDGTYLFFLPMKSAAEVDRNMAQDKDFEAAMGEDGMKKLGELSAAAIEWSESNLFAFDPAMSYASPEWVKADPDFWGPKTTKVAASKKPGEKPAMAESKAPQ